MSQAETEHYSLLGKEFNFYTAKSAFTGEQYSVEIDYSRDSLLDDTAKTTLTEKNYQLRNETSPQESFARAAISFASSKEHAQRMYDYVSKLWFMYSSPILSNGGTDKGLPISCFLSFMGDSKEGIAKTWQEMFHLSISGGGTAVDMSAIRSIGQATSKGNYTPGLMPFAKVVDSITMASIQGSSRRGASNVNLSVSHPEIIEFLASRKPTGDHNRKLWNIHHSVSIPDSFMEAVKKGAPWNLVDPHTKQIIETVDARTLWLSILETRCETGEPLIHFIDTSNRFLPQQQRDMGLRVNTSNICMEITLPTNEERTAVCCLSSVNLEKLEDWKDDPLFLGDLTEFLDNVLEVFIQTAPPELSRAVASAKAERAIGIGTLGWHSLLQSRNIPFESVMAVSLNKKIFKHIAEQTDEASRRLAAERGEPADIVGSGRRNSHIRAIAPNATSAIIAGTSPSIEPYNSNYYNLVTAAGTFTQRNKYLDRVLKEEYGLDKDGLEEAWSKILSDGGSVRSLSYMSTHHKDVFKTAFELDQQWVIQHAADRQPHICQAQSVNIFLPLGTDRNYAHKLHFLAWELGLKTLYYVRNKSAIKMGINVNDEIKQGCLSCEG